MELVQAMEKKVQDCEPEDGAPSKDLLANVAASSKDFFEKCLRLGLFMATLLPRRKAHAMGVVGSKTRMAQQYCT